MEFLRILLSNSLKHYGDKNILIVWNWLRVVLKENELLFPFLAHLINTPEKSTLALREILSLFFE